jgi:hypothetical protein
MLSSVGDEGLWNVHDLAARWKCSKSWIYQLAEADLIPRVHIPGSAMLRFDPAAIRELEHSKTPPREPPRILPSKKRGS